MASTRLRERAHVDGMTASAQVMAAHVGRYPSESALVVKRSGQSFGFPEIPSILPSSASGNSAFRRSKRMSMACSSVSRVSGRWVNAVSACSKYLMASRLTERAKALAPACRR